METTTTPENDNKRKKSYESSSRSSGDDDDDDVNEEEDENSILKSNDSNDSMELPSPPALEKMKKIKKMNGNNDRGTDSNNENNDNNLNNYKKEKVKDKDKVKDKEKKGEKEVEKEEKEFNIEDYRNVRIKQPVNQDYSLCYICQGHPVPGKFDPQKAKALGVIPGKQFGLLSKGECVTTPNGKVVRPEQVKESDRISSIFIVIDCPSLDHIPSLIHQKSFQNPKVLRYTKNIIHILGDPAILKNSSYQSWMKQFSEDCNHIIVSSNYCSEHINFLSNSYMQYKLHQVDSQAFPLLYFSNEIKESLKSNTDLPKNIISACNNLQVHIEPKEHLDYSKVKENFNFQSIPIKITDKLKNNAESIHYLKSNIDHWRQEHPFSTFSEATDIEIVTLGTGSALPSKYRNVSSTIILSKRNGNILLDAGEGTFGQISRHFGPEKTLHDILPRIKMIFVSHIHADHHLGMMNLLSVMASLHRTSDNPLYIIAPEKFNIWLEEYSVIQDIGLNTFIKVVPSYLLFNKFIDKYTSYSEILDYLNMSNIETIPVMHVRGACAIVFDFKDCSLEHVSSSSSSSSSKHNAKPKPIRIAYSGDCRPNREFIRAGMGADVLIHESTFESELDYEAVKKFHCTINEACIVGRCMKVKFLLLTHFSQRYPKVPLFPVFNSNEDNLSDLLYSPIFDVLPAFPHNSRSSIKCITGVQEVLSKLSPSKNHQNVSIVGEGIPLNLIISPTQLIPSAKESIMKIEALWKERGTMKEEPMKIGIAIDHFHIRLGYDEYCMEWITEAMRLLIPDDEEEEEEEEEETTEDSEELELNQNNSTSINIKKNKSKLKIKNSHKSEITNTDESNNKNNKNVEVEEESNNESERDSITTTMTTISSSIRNDDLSTSSHPIGINTPLSSLSRSSSRETINSLSVPHDPPSFTDHPIILNKKIKI
ncbi:hypothetical protein LY90DRAFT_513307 [Neocallimastix californiae]|uniref:ribonuclease Z n=1 Tax=Neocallimastix californiae TaxID=1754190 RepID=A0A1Y2AZ29_9FUNG|nr:hypothetical protein LY90DRAFT_513307 [Neocallimastix californiae]|eukprot:ORY27828.1 hypothetical protein LY90DRAFT_513307 [Neocallimastix californiae]